MHPMVMHPRAVYHPFDDYDWHMGSGRPEKGPRDCTQYSAINNNLFQPQAPLFNDEEDMEMTDENQSFGNLFRLLFENPYEKRKQNGAKTSTPERSMCKETNTHKRNISTPKTKSATNNNSLTNQDAQYFNGITITKLDLSRYDPNSITVRSSEEKKTVTVKAKRPVFTLYGSNMRENTFTVPIPEDIAARDIRSLLSPDGIFYLRAPPKYSNVTQSDSNLDPSER